jgi:hypothetical protein
MLQKNKLSTKRTKLRTVEKSLVIPQLCDDLLAVNSARVIRDQRAQNRKRQESKVKGSESASLT